MDNNAEGCLTQLWELFTLIPYMAKDFKRYWHHYMMIFVSQIKNEVFLRVQGAKFYFSPSRDKKVMAAKDDGKSSEVR